MERRLSYLKLLSDNEKEKCTSLPKEAKILHGIKTNNNIMVNFKDLKFLIRQCLVRKPGLGEEI